MTYPVEVSEKCYQDIESYLERYYNSPQCPFSRIWENGKRMGTQAVIERFNLEITTENDEKDVRVRLISKEAHGSIAVDEVFDRVTGKDTKEDL